MLVIYKRATITDFVATNMQITQVQLAGVTFRLANFNITSPIYVGIKTDLKHNCMSIKKNHKCFRQQRLTASSRERHMI